VPRRAQPVHALEVARIDRLALAQDDEAALLGERDRDAADRLHQRTPLIRMAAAEFARGLLRVDRLAFALADEAEQGGFDCLGTRTRGLLFHVRRIADSDGDSKRGLSQNERSCYFGAMTDLAKGDRTRSRILDEAVGLASVQGIGALTIGPLAERLGLSKSGLFAHFRSKEALQVETLERAAELFRADVTDPLRAEPDRTRRLQMFFERWIDWLDKSGLPGGCPILAAAIEFDDVPGPVHDVAARQFAELQHLIVRFARAAKPDGDAEALAAAVIGLAMSHLVRVRLLGERKARAVTMRAFENLLD